MSDVVDCSPATEHDPPVVLLVDEDADTREMYGMFLASSGFAVDEAPDAYQALSKVRSVLPDVVVTDITLRGMDGFALCHEIRRDDRTARIPVIAVTGYSTATRVEEAERAGFDAFLLKPCAPDDLLAQIGRTIQVTRRLRAQSAMLRAESERLRRDTRELHKRTAATLKRVFKDADRRHRKR